MQCSTLFEVDFKMNARSGFGYGREVLHISKIIAEYVMELSLKMVKNVCETI